MPSFSFSVNPREKKRGRFIRRVRNEIQKSLVEEKSKRKLTQAALAKILGVDRSVINKQLMGTGNLTLASVADFAWALNRDIEFSFVEPKVAVGSNVPARTPPRIEASDKDVTSIQIDSIKKTDSHARVSGGFVIRSEV